MRIAYVCFFAAALHGLVGMALGIYMGVGGDFSLAPAHAHINLLGWVTLCLYGLYHRGVERTRSRLAWTQVGCAALGTPVMTGSLALYLASGAETKAFVVAAMLSSFPVAAGMALFLAVLVADLLPDRSAAPRAARPARA